MSNKYRSRALQVLLGARTRKISVLARAAGEIRSRRKGAGLIQQQLLENFTDLSVNNPEMKKRSKEEQRGTDTHTEREREREREREMLSFLKTISRYDNSAGSPA